jgi:hypothetical protein
MEYLLFSFSEATSTSEVNKVMITGKKIAMKLIYNVMKGKSGIVYNELCRYKRVSL